MDIFLQVRLPVVLLTDSYYLLIINLQCCSFIYIRTQRNNIQPWCLFIFLFTFHIKQLCIKEANRRTCNTESSGSAGAAVEEGYRCVGGFSVPVMTSLQPSPRLHPWCYVCKSAALCVWTPVWSFLKDRNTTRLPSDLLSFGLDAVTNKSVSWNCVEIIRLDNLFSLISHTISEAIV